MEMLSQREHELTKITQITGRGFFTLYGLAFIGNFALRRGTMPYFKDIVKHFTLMVAGAFVVGRASEKIAAEFYYNRVLI
jgi:hypothetical protein